MSRSIQEYDFSLKDYVFTNNKLNLYCERKGQISKPVRS